MIKEYLTNKIVNCVIQPFDLLVNESITNTSTLFSSYIVKSVTDKLQRSIVLTTGVTYNDYWIEDALFNMLSKYNDFKKSSQLKLVTTRGNNSNLFYSLSPGTHRLKYRKWNILLNIQHDQSTSGRGVLRVLKIFTVICFDLSPEFLKVFEKELLDNKDKLMRLRTNSRTINIYKDFHEVDGTAYWDMHMTVNKRPISSIYLPDDQMKLIKDTIDNFIASKGYYNRHGIPHNLKILLYGPPGTGKSSIVKMIASHWNMNIYECTGGKNGAYIPNSLTSNSPDKDYRLFSISDIDKYPILINEPDINKDSDKDEDKKLNYKQVFNNMINALDGIMSGEDKIIIMTTNHIDKFSPTLLRPGRIDLQIKIDYINEEVFRKYIKTFFNKDIPEDIKLKNKKITIADLQFDVVFLKMSFDDIMRKYLK